MGGKMQELSEYELNVQNLSSFIGNTPLLEIEFRYKGETRKLYAKAENMNMTGSIKDRMALHILHRSYKEGLLSPSDTIIEATSGNTGIAFCAIGRALGHPVTIFMPDWMSFERKSLIKSLGAHIILISKEEGGFQGCINRSEELAKEIGTAFLPKQFSNAFNIDAHYLSTGPEIWWQLQFHSLIPDGFVAGVGTGGTVMGIGKFLRENNPNVKVHPLEPLNSPTITTGGKKVGVHRIEGISDEFIPPIVDLNELDEIISVDDGDSVIMSQKLSRELGLAVGISSGANFLGALLAQKKLGKDSTVVTVFPDDNKKYLSTDLMKEEPIEEGFISPDIELVRFRTFNRVCYTCCNPVNCYKSKTLELSRTEPLPQCPRRC